MLRAVHCGLANVHKENFIAAFQDNLTIIGLKPLEANFLEFVVEIVTARHENFNLFSRRKNIKADNFRIPLKYPIEAGETQNGKKSS